MIKVLVVEDSVVVQQLLCHILASDPDIQVAGVARDGQEALARVCQSRPDVITMDIHMPRMDGFEATRQIMEQCPTPIVIVSGSFDVSEVNISFQALEAGALAVIGRPPGLGHPGFPAAAHELLQTVKLMSEVKVVTRRRRFGGGAAATALAGPGTATSPRAPGQGIMLAAIGASTGGPVVLQQILGALPPGLPFPLLIVQHIAEGFVRGFVDWLSSTSGFPLALASHGDLPLPGRGYLAPDGFHLGVGPGPRLILSTLAPEHNIRPSVSFLFRSVAQVCGPRAVGILLTGMGSDGARELGLMKEQGAVTIAQDKTSSLIHGMPGTAIALGAATHVLSPEAIAAFLATVARPDKGASHE